MMQISSNVTSINVYTFIMLTVILICNERLIVSIFAKNIVQSKLLKSNFRDALVNWPLIESKW